LIDAEFQRLVAIDTGYTTYTSPTSIVYRPFEFLMAEKTVATIISKTLEQAPKYCGKSDQNVDEWLKDPCAKFRMAEVTEPRAVKIGGCGMWVRVWCVCVWLSSRSPHIHSNPPS
jgi:hypothetical protein